MAVYYDIQTLTQTRYVVTIGSFDGVHCGHRALISRVKEIAGQSGSRSAVVTFWPHPRQVIDQRAPLLLNTLEEKIALLTQTGIDDIIVFPFSEELSRMEAPEFIREIIVGKLNALCLVAGEDHHFGKNRTGNTGNLSSFINHHELKTEVVGLKKFDTKISSSSIRKALTEGNLEPANQMLGYGYMISGKVISGNHIGQTIGFPTANIEAPACKLIPKEGVYRVEVSIEETEAGNLLFDYSRLGMMYIGRRPVLKQGSDQQHIEVNIFDFDGQIYGKTITLSLTHRIRNDINFDNLEQLTEQLKHDKQTILNI